jgi:hypothetical protein
MAAGTSPIIPELPIIRARGEGKQRATFFERSRPSLRVKVRGRSSAG